MTQIIRVLMLPDYRADNPYQQLLIEALSHENILVVFPVGYRRVFPIFRAVLDTQSSLDIVHLHWISPYIKGETKFTKALYAFKFLLDVVFVKLCGIRLVWTVHNQVSHDSSSPELEYWLRRQICRLVHQVIVHHQSAKALIAEAYHVTPAKLRTVPIGHYRSIYPPPVPKKIARLSLSIPQSRRLLYLSQGMIRPYKGIENLVQVWSQTTKISKEHLLIIAGQPLDKVYSQFISRLAQELVKDPGSLSLNLRFIENHELALLFSTADCVVLPFNQILTSSSVVVAMSFGKPVIAPRLGGIPETLAGADDLLYDPEDPQGLAKALQKSTKIDLDELSQRTTEACDRLNWSEIARKTKAVYIGER